MLQETHLYVVSVDETNEVVVDAGAISRLLLGAEGFLVDDERAAEVGVVEDVTADEAGHVRAVDVCGGWFGRRRWSFAPGDVVAIWPAQRRIVVSNDAVRRQSPGRRAPEGGA